MAVECTTRVPSRVAVHNVAVATDFSSCSEHAVEHGIAIARHFGATLHFLHLLRPSRFAFSPEMMPALADAADRDCEQLLTRLTHDHRLDGIDVRRSIEQGEIADVADAFVRDQHIDMLILGTRGRTGLPRLLLGSAAQQMFQSVSCPVLAVGPRAPGAGPKLQLRHILFATDLSRDSLAALPYALTAAGEWHTALDVLHVCKSGDPSHRVAIEKLAASLAPGLADDEAPPAQGTPASPPQGHVFSGKASPTVLAFAAHHQADLIVLGLKPHRALYNGSPWSHAYEIVRQAPCPVLSIRPAPS